MAVLKTGGEVDAFCTKCKMVLAHTIIAIWAGDIKRVRCNTCMGEHAFRKSEPGSSSSTSTRSSTPKAKAAPTTKAVEKVSASTYDSLIAGKDRSAAKRYSPKDKYAVGELVAHPTFGLGVVAAVRGLDKGDLAFPGSVKTLLHNKGAAPVPMARPVPHKQPDVTVDESQEEDPTAETSDEG